MLVLTRHANESVLLPSVQVSVRVVSVKGGAVRLGVEAPRDVPVFREEIFDRAAWEAREQRRKADAEQRLHRLAHQTRNRLSSSTVGLALLRKQVEMGLVDALPGTLDRIERELAALRQQVEGPAETLPAPAERPAKARRALLVEDDRNECELLAGFLRLAGLEVDTAGDGSDALDYLRSSGRPDVVLLDMLLPRCDGPTTVRAIRGDPALRGLKVFGVTGASPERLGLERGPAGVDGWFLKPLNPELLLRALTEDLEASA